MKKSGKININDVININDNELTLTMHKIKSYNYFAVEYSRIIYLPVEYVNAIRRMSDEGMGSRLDVINYENDEHTDDYLIQELLVLQINNIPLNPSAFDSNAEFYIYVKNNTDENIKIYSKDIKSKKGIIPFEGTYNLGILRPNKILNIPLIKITKGYGYTNSSYKPFIRPSVVPLHLEKYPDFISKPKLMPDGTLDKEAIKRADSSGYIQSCLTLTDENPKYLFKCIVLECSNESDCKKVVDRNIKLLLDRVDNIKNIVNDEIYYEENQIESEMYDASLILLNETATTVELIKRGLCKLKDIKVIHTKAIQGDKIAIQIRYNKPIKPELLKCIDVIVGNYNKLLKYE